MDSQDRRITIHREEMESLLNLKSKLDHAEAVDSYAAKYRQLGWALQVQHRQDGAGLEIDAGADPETGGNCRWEPGLPESEMNLGVHAGKGSRIMVLEVAKGQGEAVLDQYGPWRAECIAVLGTGRERHFYAWDPSPCFDSASGVEATEFTWYGEGQVISVPPSVEAETSERWQWLSPPWETPLQRPGQGVADFLQHHLSREPRLRPEVSLSWQEVYCLVSPFEPLLQALAASNTSMEGYYQGILTAAAEAGINAPEVLLAVLWHAPRGNARQYPEGLEDLQKLVAAAQLQPAPDAGPENALWQLSQDNGRSQVRDFYAGIMGPDKPGPQPFFKRRRVPRPHPGKTMRTPFSGRKIGGI
jgi:hypothetical protein